MKKLILPFLVLVLLSSCNDSTSDEFNEENQNTTVKLISNITFTSAQDSDENKVITVNYTDNDRVTSVTDGEETSVMVYENNELVTVTGEGDPLNVEELYESPYDAFETGQVIDYDSNGNPRNLMFFEEDYDYNTNTYVTNEYTAELTYDDKPNPYFYTLDAAGIIDVMDGVDLDFNMNPQVADIVTAKELFPVKNLKKIVYKNDEGETVFEITANYTYNSDDYPTFATVTSVSYEDNENETSVFTLSYTYR